MGRRLPVLLLAGAAALAGDPPAEAVRLNEAGIEHLLAGRAERAAAAFEAGLEAAPDSVAVRRNLAAALVALAEEAREARRNRDALDLLDRAVALHPERLRYRVLRGRARFESDSDALRSAAREDFAWVLERDPDHLDALVNLGQIAYLERRLDEAIEAWTRALELRPGDADVAARLAKARREQEVERSFLELQDPHFLVRYPPGLALDRAQQVLALCQEVRGELSTLYRSYPPRIVVTLYTPAQFSRATSTHAWVAGLSDGTIRLTVPPDAPLAALRATLTHELTHHIVRGLAPEAPVWLHEGLAQLEEGRRVEAADARLAREEVGDASILSARVLDQRDPRRVSVFYDVALSFTHYLRDARRGSIHDLLRALGEGRPEGEAIRAVYGASRDELFARWREHTRAR